MDSEAKMAIQKQKLESDQTLAFIDARLERDRLALEQQQAEHQQRMDTLELLLKAQAEQNNRIEQQLGQIAGSFSQPKQRT